MPPYFSYPFKLVTVKHLSSDEYSKTFTRKRKITLYIMWLFWFNVKKTTKLLFFIISQVTHNKNR